MWNRTVLGALGLGLGLAAVALALAAPRTHSAFALTNCSTTSESIDSAEQSLFQQLNAYRAQSGLAALKLSPNLSRAGAFITEDMKAKGYFNHFEPSGRSPFQRALDCGHPSSNIGENLAISGSSSGAMTLWKNSTAGHNEAMLLSKWKVVGIGQAGGYWALVFGVTDDSGGSGPPPSPPSLPASPTPQPSPTPDPNGPTLFPIRRAMLQMVASE